LLGDVPAGGRVGSQPCLRPSWGRAAPAAWVRHRRGRHVGAGRVRVATPNAGVKASECRWMSSVIDIVFDRDVAGYAPDDRYSLACVYFEAEFEELAKRLGVAPLTAFYCDDPNSLDNYFDDPAELEALKQRMGPEKFFEPADALRSVTALRDHLRES